ncbi:hypothetical protein BDW42DRAFT_175970 [Aspergillus taichungensis]|uniref:Uncharacterized protein n=1 Tax=Aspergillus taichungensis TaxID=482145 RepID=A0A2J5HLI3_9EURO|nr:hypothetical protein BDW42DRAFT_175970 [Aspergillus taichungensis]
MTVVQSLSDNDQPAKDRKTGGVIWWGITPLMPCQGIVFYISLTIGWLVVYHRISQ